MSGCSGCKSEPRGRPPLGQDLCPNGTGSKTSDATSDIHCSSAPRIDIKSYPNHIGSVSDRDRIGSHRDRIGSGWDRIGMGSMHFFLVLTKA